MRRQERGKRGSSRTGRGEKRGHPQVNPRALPVSLRLRVVEEVLQRQTPVGDEGVRDLDDDREGVVPAV
jgi:hypothetical protein